MALLDPENGKDRRNLRGPTPQYAKMPRSGRVIIDPAKLRYWRNVRGITRSELAEAARMSVYSVKEYERGVRFPRDSAFRRLYTALGISAEDLMFSDCRYIRKTKETDDA